MYLYVRTTSNIVEWQLYGKVSINILSFLVIESDTSDRDTDVLFYDYFDVCCEQ